jgi:hypothetical protein
MWQFKGTSHRVPHDADLWLGGGVGNHMLIPLHVYHGHNCTGGALRRARVHNTSAFVLDMSSLERETQQQ